jgi:hypothetical protein
VRRAAPGETQNAGQTFRSTFDLLNEAYGNDALRRFTNGQPGGRVGLVAFECIAIGIAKNINNVMGKANRVQWVQDRIQQLWESPDVNSFFAAGLRGTIRIQRTITFGTQWFAA